MDRMTVSLDDGNSDWVQQQAGDNADAYVNELVRKDQARKAAEAELRRMLDEADASGISPRTPQQIFAEAKAKLKADGRL